MAKAVNLRTKVLPGHRVEVSTPELEVGQTVRVIVVEETPPDRANGEASDARTMQEYLDSLPEGPRSADTWEEVERNLQAERDAWDA